MHGKAILKLGTVCFVGKIIFGVRVQPYVSTVYHRMGRMKLYSMVSTCIFQLSVKMSRSMLTMRTIDVEMTLAVLLRLFQNLPFNTNA
jgi:hypothetical protein